MAVLNFPSSPIDGQAYVAPNGSTYIYDATETVWKAQGADGDNTVVVSSTAPVSPTQGKLWWNTTTGTLFIYYQDGDSNQWIPAAIPGPTSISDGQTVSFESITTKSVNGGPLAGFRNQFINGTFETWQRGTSVAISTQAGNVYSADRWVMTGSTTGTGNLARASGTNAPVGFDYALQMPAGAKALVQGIELGIKGNGSAMVGKFVLGSTWTVSVYSDQDISAATPKTNASFRDSTSNEIGQTNATSGAGGLTWVAQGSADANGFTRYAATFTIGAVPPDTNTHTCFTVSIPGPNLTGFVTKYSGAQLEPGPVATPFEHRPIGTELALCQRYYYKETGDIRIICSRLDQNTGSAFGQYSFPQTMRDVPTFEALGDWTSGSGYGGLPKLSRTNTVQAVLSTSVSVVANGILFLNNESDSGTLAFDAEL